MISSTKLMTPLSSRVSTQKGFDVFNALDLMENKTFLEKLKFGIGDGNLQYYLYNWKCPIMGADKVRLPVYIPYIFFDVCQKTNVFLFFISGKPNLSLYYLSFRLGWCCSDIPLTTPQCHQQARRGRTVTHRPPERQTDDFLFGDRKRPPPIFTSLTLQTLTCTTVAG